MTVATATESAAADLQETSHAANIDLAPPFWGWQQYPSPTPNGFWSAQDFGPGDGTLVNQLGRQSAAALIGVKVTDYRKALDFGGSSIVAAQFTPVSLSAIGANIQQWVYMQAGGAFANRRIYPGQTVTLALRASGVRNFRVGCYQIHRLGSQYGEIICRVSKLTRYPIFGAESEDAGKALALAGDDDELNAALEAALDGGEGEEIPFQPRKVADLESR